jgi:hypothetical protein
MRLFEPQSSNLDSSEDRFGQLCHRGAQVVLLDDNWGYRGPLRGYDTPNPPSLSRLGERGRGQRVTKNVIVGDSGSLNGTHRRSEQRMKNFSWLYGCFVHWTWTRNSRCPRLKKGVLVTCLTSVRFRFARNGGIKIAYCLWPHLVSIKHA